MKISDNNPQSMDAGRAILIHNVKNTIFLAPPDITCLEGEGNYTYIYTYSGKKYLVARTIKNLHMSLNESNDFVRIHKSYLINTNHIVDYAGQDRTITMAGGKEVLVSRRKSREINQILSAVL
jgi:two-component system LytT family response regulator